MDKIKKIRRKRDRSLAFSIKKNRKLYGKFLIIMMVFLIISNMHWVYSVDSSGWSGSVLDPIIEGGSEYSTSIASQLADAAIQLLSLSFSPNFFTLMGTEKPGLLYGTVPKQLVKESYFFSTVFGLGQMLGIIIATVLFFVNAFMLIIGKENQIRDNPIVLLIRYIVSMTAVFLSFDIVYAMIMSIDEIWSQYVFRSYTSIYAGQSFYQVETSRIFTQDPETGNIIAWGTHLNVKMNGIWIAVVSGMSILLIWKLLKSVFRLFLEVAERYFVLMVLCAFFPVAVATYTCNTTKNIFFSYLRMFFCQAFVMLANIAFMKFFLFVLFNGGWLASLTNYICALSFIRVAQRLDSYMMAMGLNVAQTGAGILGAMQGAGIGLIGMFRGANNARKNVGKSLIGAGISQNNAGIFKAGATLGLSGDTLVRGLVPTDTSFENAISHYSGVNSQGFTASKDPENISSANTATDDTWLRNTLRENGIPTTDIDKLRSKGIDPNSIVRVEKDQRTGAIGYNDEKGAVATSYKGEMYNNKKREQEMEYTGKQAELSQKYDTEVKPGQTMSEAEAARIAMGLGDLNTDVSHVELDTLKSLYAGDYDSLETIPATKKEQSQMLNGDNDVVAVPYGMDSVGHSRMQFRGRYMDQMEPKTDDFFVDMYNVAQHPETLKNQGQVGWHFVKQGDEGFMVHDNRHTASERASVVGQTSPHYQKAKPDLTKPDNHINSTKPTGNPKPDPNPEGKGGGSKPNPTPGGKGGDSKPNPTPGGNGEGSKPDPTSGDKGGSSKPDPTSGDKGGSSKPDPTSGDKGEGSKPNPTPGGNGGGSMPDPVVINNDLSSFATTTAGSIPVVKYSHTIEDVNDTYERIYGSGQDKEREKGATRRNNSKRDKERNTRNDNNSKKPKSGKGKGKNSRRYNDKNIPVDFDDY